MVLLYWIEHLEASFAPVLVLQQDVVVEEPFAVAIAGKTPDWVSLFAVFGDSVVGRYLTLAELEESTDFSESG